MEPAEILKATPFFAEVLDDAEIEMLAARAHFVSFPKGATPIEEDGPGHAMFVIVSGEAVRHRPRRTTTAGRDASARATSSARCRC